MEPEGSQEFSNGSNPKRKDIPLNCDFALKEVGIFNIHSHHKCL